MTALSAEPPADLALVADDRWAGLTQAQDRKFWMALAAASILHAALFIGAAKSVPRTVGATDGLDDAISVSVVTEADLQSRSTVAERAEPHPERHP